MSASEATAIARRVVDILTPWIGPGNHAEIIPSVARILTMTEAAHQPAMRFGRRAVGDQKNGPDLGGGGPALTGAFGGERTVKTK